MKLQSFHFKFQHLVRERNCAGCKKSLDKTLQIRFDARPKDEWELVAECVACKRDHTLAVVMMHGMATPMQKIGVRGKNGVLNAETGKPVE